MSTGPRNSIRSRRSRTGTGFASWDAGRLRFMAALTDAQARPVMVAAGLEPLEPYKNAATKWKCRCKICKKTCAERYSDVSRRAGRRGCQACCSDAIDPKKAKALMLKAGLEPLEPYKNAATRWKYRCKLCGREDAQTLEQVSSRSTTSASQGYKNSAARSLFQDPVHAATRKGCTKCVIGVIGGGIDATTAEKRLRSAGFEPVEPFPGNMERWKCVCKKCKGATAVRLTRVTSGFAKCRYCAGPPDFEPHRGLHLDYLGAFDYTAPAILYLISHRDLKAAKVGVTHSVTSLRMQQHKEGGWGVLRTWKFRCGADAKIFEDEVLDYWDRSWAKDNAAASRLVTERRPRLSKFQIPQAGHSETAFLKDIDLEKTMALVKPRRLPKRELPPERPKSIRPSGSASSSRW